MKRLIRQFPVKMFVRNQRGGFGLAKQFREDYPNDQDIQTVAEKREWTDEALRALPRDGQKCELLGGALVVSPTGFQHGYISSRLSTALSAFAFKRRLGVVVDSCTGFRLKNGDCLSPDVSFVRKERLQKGITQQFFQRAPDLAVEVLSPGESLASIRRKLAAYFADGTRLAWVVNPKDTTVRVYHSPRRFGCLRCEDSLHGEDLLPGFALPVAALFKVPDFGPD
jgi:Uma2 family endonuclease